LAYSLSVTFSIVAFGRISPTSSLCWSHKRTRRLRVSQGPSGVQGMTTQNENQLQASVADEARQQQLFHKTPLIKSIPISKIVGKDVYIKLDALQASGSFKDRGMGHLCSTLQAQGVRKVISSSGGNAGLAVATVGQKLGIEVSVIVPTTTKPMVIEKLQSLGAQVTVHGENWNAADSLARQKVAESSMNTAYVSPYDNPLLWTGHSTLVDEVLDQLERNLGAIIVSVGGGGLLCGILEGLARRGCPPTTVIAAETQGAASFGKARQQGKIVRLKAIDSIATSLGALEVAPAVLKLSKEHEDAGGRVLDALCTDAEAVDACLRFAQDHRILVEPACGAALAVAYTERLRNECLSQITDGPIVLEVCGGSGVSVDLLHQWKAQFLL
jgi:L-serine/L-threonine ammonia-lyase